MMGVKYVFIIRLMAGLILAGLVPVSQARAQKYDPAEVEVISKILKDNDSQGILAAAGWKAGQPESWRNLSDKSQKQPIQAFLTWKNKKLEKIVFYNTRLTGVLDLAGLSGVKGLTIRLNNLDEIKGLETMSDLESLKGSHNQLKSLGDLSGLSQLRELDVSANQLSRLGELSGLKQLNRLNVSYNELTELGDLSALNQLTELSAARNRLTALTGLDQLTELKKLALERNRLENIGSLSQLGQLEYVDVRSNSLENIGDLSGLSRLTYLDAGFNQLTGLEGLSAFEALKELSLEYNQLNQLPDLSQMKVLKNLSISGNKFESSGLMEKLPERGLESLAFSGDQFPVFNLAGDQLAAIQKLRLNRPEPATEAPAFQALELAGHPLKSLYLREHVPAERIIEPGPLERLIIDGNYSMAELLELQQKLKPEKFDIISSQHPKLGDLSIRIKSGQAYPLAEVSPRLAADYQAAGATAKLIIGEKANYAQLSFAADESVGLDFARVRSELERVRVSEAYSFQDGQITFHQAGREYFAIIISDDLGGSGAPAFIIYRDVFKTQ